jgi:hypothetical protein
MLRLSTILLLIIFLILIIILLLDDIPYAKYILIQRADGDNKYIAIKDIEVINTRGSRVDINGITGKGLIQKGYLNSAAALEVEYEPDVLLDGKTRAYVNDTVLLTSPSSNTAIGPVIAAISTDNSEYGHIMFNLGCASKIARINISVPDDDRSRINIQGVKLTLLDKNRRPIIGASGMTKNSSIPHEIHSFSFG